MRCHERYSDQRQDDPIERGAALKLEDPDTQVELDQCAHAGARDRGNACDDAQHFGERESDQREIRAAQAGTKGERAEHGTKHGTSRNADRKANPCVDAIAHLQDRGDVGARAEEGCVAKRILTPIAAENVPSLSGQRDHQCYDEEIERGV